MRKYIVLIAAGLAYSDKCTPGEFECQNDKNMRICSNNRIWVTTECPFNTKCSKTEKSIGCNLVKNFTKNDIRIIVNENSDAKTFIKPGIEKVFYETYESKPIKNETNISYKKSENVKKQEMTKIKSKNISDFSFDNKPADNLFHKFMPINAALDDALLVVEDPEKDKNFNSHTEKNFEEQQSINIDKSLDELRDFIKRRRRKQRNAENMSNLVSKIPKKDYSSKTKSYVVVCNEENVTEINEPPYSRNNILYRETINPRSPKYPTGKTPIIPENNRPFYQGKNDVNRGPDGSIVPGTPSDKASTNESPSDKASTNESPSDKASPNSKESTPGGESKPKESPKSAGTPGKEGSGTPSENVPAGNAPPKEDSNKPSYTGNDKLNQKPRGPINPSSSAGAGSGNIITVEQLTKAMQEHDFDPPVENIQAVVNETNEYFDDPEMAAMFLGQLAHESGGFIYREEMGCEKGQCAFMYPTGGAPGKSYHGRGFIQLSYPENYKLASQDLGYGNTLWEKPEMISDDPKLSAKVSTWYWDTRVMKYPGVTDKKEFGLTTRSINGAVECNGQNVEKSKRRYTLYKTIAKHMGITNLVGEGGCY